MQLVYTSASLLLHLCPAQGLLRLGWQAGVSSAGFLQGLTAAVTLTHAQGVRHWLTLNHHVYPLAPAEQLCLQEHALLPLHQSTLQRVAIVLPPRAFGGPGYDSLIADSRALVSYQLEYFPGIVPARQWLQGGGDGV
ncbi:hypothetical protein [uncultured Hymenobacter sp.]|uniref:hypothetical protein n=1 Tax=uncultured Hymenobacter sp. TaxID=170016 RepID=UPI0035CC85AF